MACLKSAVRVAIAILIATTAATVTKVNPSINTFKSLSVRGGGTSFHFPPNFRTATALSSILSSSIQKENKKVPLPPPSRNTRAKPTALVLYIQFPNTSPNSLLFSPFFVYPVQEAQMLIRPYSHPTLACVLLADNVRLQIGCEASAARVFVTHPAVPPRACTHYCCSAVVLHMPFYDHWIRTTLLSCYGLHLSRVYNSMRR